MDDFSESHKSSLLQCIFLESESEDEEDEIIYNPKNLPLGWDGKPIPYWLYKLHGLNINYKCEICGNQTYRGPKAFQRHFSVSCLAPKFPEPNNPNCSLYAIHW